MCRRLCFSQRRSWRNARTFRGWKKFWNIRHRCAVRGPVVPRCAPTACPVRLCSRVREKTVSAPHTVCSLRKTASFSRTIPLRFRPSNLDGGFRAAREARVASLPRGPPESSLCGLRPHGRLRCAGLPGQPACSFSRFARTGALESAPTGRLRACGLCATESSSPR